MTHGQVGFQLTHGIEYHAYHNQQTGTSEELRHHERNTEIAIEEHREYCENEQEKRAARSNSGHRGIKEISSGLSGTDSRGCMHPLS